MVSEPSGTCRRVERGAPGKLRHRAAGRRPALRLPADADRSGRSGPVGRTRPNHESGRVAAPAQQTPWVSGGSCRVSLVQRGVLFLQARELALDVGDEKVGHVVTQAALDHHTQRTQVGPVLGERVRGHEPAALAERVRDVEDRVVLDVVVQREREDRQLGTAGDEPEGAELLDLARRGCVATSRA